MVAMCGLSLWTWMIYFYLFVFGSVVGSFLNVCIYRIPSKEGFWESLRSIVWPPSACPRCKNRIPGRFNIPILGWLFLRGRCYSCKGWISPRYPLIECFNGLLWVVLYALHVPGDFGTSLAESWVQGPLGPTASYMGWIDTPSLIMHVRFAYHLVLIEALLVASFIDFDLYIIPDGATLPAMFVGVLGSLTGKVYLTPVWHQDSTMRWLMRDLVPDWMMLTHRVPDWIREWPHLHGLAVSLTGLVVGGGFTWLMRIIGQWGLRRETIGFGDVILMAMIGSFLGWQAPLIIFFVAPVVALATLVVSLPFRAYQRVIPYGPYLSLAALGVVMFWKPVWIRTERIFGTGPLLFVIGAVMLVLFAGLTRSIYVIKRMLGFVDQLEFGEWTSGDHLFHYSGETVDPRVGRWSTSQEWPGADSGRGWTQNEVWRHPAVGGLQQHWQRRSQ